MTAEIAIVNRNGIALAADSALTIGSDRVWNSSNKLFSLGPDNDIAVMVYGAGQFEGFPWELIIKLFRKETADQRFSTVESCSTAFLSFLRDARFKADDQIRRAALFRYVEVLEFIRDSIKDVGNSSNISQRALLSACEDFLDTFKDYADITDLSGCPTEEELLIENEKIFIDLAKDIFRVSQVSKKTLKNLGSCLFLSVRKTIFDSNATGVVFAGFGETELFPAVLEVKCDGKVGDFLRSWVVRKIDTNEEKRSKTIIIPFAQDDIFKLFVEGISPVYEEFLGRLLSNLLREKSDRLIDLFVREPREKTVEKAKQNRENQKIIEYFDKEFRHYRHRAVVSPILEVVNALPKDEMGELARALVELTSLRRKVDAKLQSVGGPVDVAVISKGDGLVWLQRKHYFELDKNPDFLQRRLRRKEDSDDAP